MFFNVNITPQAKKPANIVKDEPKSPPILTLAPFQPAPQINLEACINTSTSCSISIKNVANRLLTINATKMPPKERGVSLSCSEILIQPNSEASVAILWTPRELGCWRDTIRFTDNRKIKYDVFLTTTVIDKRVQTKVKSRVLGPANDNREYQMPQAFKSHQSTVKVKKENKENSVDIIETRPAKSNLERIQVESNLNISLFQLTPIKTTIKVSDQPELRVNKAPQDTQLPEIKFTDASPSIIPSEHSLNISAESSNSVLRRETYVKLDSKYFKEIIPTVKEERFDDSLSPVPTKEEEFHFSTWMNDVESLEMSTRVNSPASVTTSFRCKSPTATMQCEYTRTFGSADGTEKATNQTYELIRMSDPPSHSCNPKRLADQFEKMPEPIGVSEINRLSSCPMEIGRFSQSLHQSDNATAKDIIEADLWAKDMPTHKISTQSTSVSGKSKEFCGTISISPPDRKQYHHRLSPMKSSIKGIVGKKPSPIALEKSLPASSESKFKPSLKTPMKKTAKKPIPGVKIPKLSLASLNSSISHANSRIKAESGFKFPSCSDFVALQVDPSAACATEDPFLAHTMFYDEQWLYKQEVEFTKWLNVLLTPPEQLEVDVETVKVDIGKVWQSCRAKERVDLAETREAVSARYHTNTRLHALRKAALVMFKRDAVMSILHQTTLGIERGILTIRQDRNLHRDVGLQKEILELLLSYNPLWLRIALEVVYNEVIPLSSNNDLVGLTRFIQARFFSDPFLVQTYSLPNVMSIKQPAFQEHMNKFILKKFLQIVYFLDYAKTNKLIGHDPCLFHKKAAYKESREILLAFSRAVLSGVGDVTKVLRSYKYVVTYKQTPLDEYNYAVADISTGLRDGVRLCRVMELITGDKTLTGQCRMPAISRLQKLHNANVALTALSNAGYVIAGKIDAKSVVDGHREKTLSLLWQIIHKFQAPRLDRAARILQRWWQAKVWYVRMQKFLSLRRNNAAHVIQRAWRKHEAVKMAKSIRETRIAELSKQKEAARVILRHWREVKLFRAVREEFLMKKYAAICIQRCFQRRRATLPFVRELERKRMAAKTIQKWWRKTTRIKQQTGSFYRVKAAVLVIQSSWRAYAVMKSSRNDYLKLRAAAIIIQRRWRAQKLMQAERKQYLDKYKAILVIQARVKSFVAHRKYCQLKTATIVIQARWRAQLAMREQRKSYLEKIQAAVTIQSWWKSLKAVKKYRAVQASIIVIQQHWKAQLLMKRERKLHLQRIEAAKKIQSWWRSVKSVKQIRKLKNAAVVLQRRWRARQLMKIEQADYSRKIRAIVRIQSWWISVQRSKQYRQVRAAAIVIQTRWRAQRLMKMERKNYLQQLEAVKIVQTWWRCVKAAREYQKLKTAAILIQTRWRARQLMSIEREFYLKKVRATKSIQTWWRSVCAVKKYQSLRAAAVTIQKQWRAQLLMRQERENYLKKIRAAKVIQTWWRSARMSKQYRQVRAAIIVIQTRWRAQVLMRKNHENYLQKVKAARTIQTWWRSTHAVKNYRQLQAAAATIQMRWRAQRLMRAQRKIYLRKIEAVKVIQARWRAQRLMRVQRKIYLHKIEAVKVIQARWRAQRLMRVQRKIYLPKIEAVKVIQTRWRAQQLMAAERESYLKKVRAAKVIQTSWRCVRMSRQYCKVKIAAITIQTRWRAQRLMKAERKIYLRQIGAVQTVQTWWRCVKAAREYRKLKTTTILIQSRWRAQKLMAVERESYLKKIRAVKLIQTWWRSVHLAKNYARLRAATVIIQTQWRAQRLMRAERKIYLKKIEAVILIQAWWKSVKMAREYRKLKTATSVIQSRWRAHRLMSLEHKSYLEKRLAVCEIQRWWMTIRMVKKFRQLRTTKVQAVIRIQRWWRHILEVRQSQPGFRRPKYGPQRAATMIQAAWRGHAVRRDQTKEMQSIRERHRNIAASAESAVNVGLRLSMALHDLQNFKTIGDLCLCLAHADTVTRIWPEGCVLFCQHGLVDKIYDIIDESNRSLPWMDVCLRCINILITLVKLPATTQCVLRIEYMRVIVRLMKAFYKPNPELFLHMATFFWLVLGDLKFRKEVKQNHPTMYLLKTQIFPMVQKVGRIGPFEIPNLKPDFGLKTKKPRYFKSIPIALHMIHERLVD